MAVGLLAGLSLFGMGMAKGSVEISKNEQEVQQRKDELDQKNSDIRLAAEHKRLSTDWDKTNKLIQSVKNDPTSKASQYALAKHSGKVSSLEEFKELRGETIWEVPNQGDRPTLQYLDVVDYRAPSRRGIDVLKQSVGFSDAEAYTGSTVLERERELLGGTTSSTYRRMVDEDRNIVLSRRAFEKRLSDSSTGVKQRFLQYKNNLSNFPREAEAVKGLVGAELDNKLFAIAFEQESFESGTTGVFSPADAYWAAQVDPLTINKSGVTLSTNTDDEYINKINAQINTSASKISQSNTPIENTKLKSNITNLEKQKSQYVKTKDIHKQKVDAHIVSTGKPDAEVEKKEHSGVVFNFHKDMPGIDADMLLLSKTKADEAGTPFTQTGDYVYNEVTNNINRVLEYEKGQAYKSAKYKLGDLSWKNIQKKSVADIKARTLNVSSGMTGDSVFIIPHNIVPYGTQITPEIKGAWQTSVDIFVKEKQSGDVLYTTDDDMAGYILDYHIQLSTVPGTVPDALVPTPVPNKIDVRVEALGTILDTPKGKMIKTDKGWIPYEDASTETVIVPQEVPVYQQIADIRLEASNAIANARDEARAALSKATNQEERNTIETGVKQAVKNIEEQLKKDLAQFTGN